MARYFCVLIECLYWVPGVNNFFVPWFVIILRWADYKNTTQKQRCGRRRNAATEVNPMPKAPRGLKSRPSMSVAAGVRHCGPEGGDNRDGLDGFEDCVCSGCFNDCEISSESRVQKPS